MASRKKKIGDIVRYQQPGTNVEVWGVVKELYDYDGVKYPRGPVLASTHDYYRPGLMCDWSSDKITKVVPIEDAPAEVCTALALWKMTGEFA